MEAKDILRQKAKAELKAMTRETLDQMAEAIHTRLFEIEAWRKAVTVAVTVSTNGEIETRAIIERAWAEGKTVCVPKCRPKSKALDFRTLRRFDQLETVYFGLLEPIESMTEIVRPERLDLIVVPGLLFDTRGYRLGFGGGYYDRFLKKCSALKIAQATEEQLVDRIPEEPHDVPVDMIVTPKRTISCYHSSSFSSF